MHDTTLYQHLLGLTEPWTVARADLDVAAQRVDVWVEHPKGLQWPCPECDIEGSSRNGSHLAGSVKTGQSARIATFSRAAPLFPAIAHHDPARRVFVTKLTLPEPLLLFGRLNELTPSTR